VTSIRIARIAGIPLGVHPLWLVIVVLISWSLAVGWYPERVDGISPGAAWGLGLLSALLLFASIVAHEYGHALVARSRGVEVEEIDLWLLGGVARIRGRPRQAADELAYALAGPAVTLAVVVLFALLAAALAGVDAPALDALLTYQAFVNAAILVFNLLPAFPLDGGRVLRALLWRRSGDGLAATRSAAAIGRAFGFALTALGVLGALSGAFGLLWFGVIGLFIVSAAGAESLHAEVEDAFTGVRASELMSRPAICLPSSITLDEALARIAPDPHPAFPVVEDGRVTGMLSLATIERTAPAARTTTLVRDLADHDPALRVGPDADVATLLDEPAFLQIMRAAVVDDEARPLGVLSVTDVQRALETRRLLEASGRSPGGPDR